MIESLKIAVTNVRSSYAQLRHSQEEKCGRYEKDAGHILDEMNRQDAGVGACDVHKETSDGSGKDEVLADASSPLDVVADNV